MRDLKRVLAKLVDMEDTLDRRAKHNMVLEGIRDALKWVVDEDVPDSIFEEYLNVLSTSGSGVEYMRL